MKDFENGWTGLRNYAASCGICNFEDTDDIAAAKIKAVIRDSLPESEVEGYTPVIPDGEEKTEETDPKDPPEVE